LGGEWLTERVLEPSEGTPSEHVPNELRGLTTEDARRRRLSAGPNEIYRPERISFPGILREEITEPLILLLIVTGVVYSFVGELRDAITIFVVIVLLVLAEVWTEYRAKTAISALAKLSAIKTRVVRDARIVEIDTLDVVPDDVVVLSQGTKINADARVGRSVVLQADESALTGESVPVDKKVGDPVYAGTFIVSGEGLAIVTMTGPRTRVGQIAARTKQIKPPRTALQEASKSLANTLVWVALFFAVVIPLLGVVRGDSLRLMILTGLALAFATIPEELPIVITMVLGLGSYRLSKRGFLVKRLRTAEALGTITVIATDKTGTVTLGHMTVAATWPADEMDVIDAAFAAASEYAVEPIDVAVRERALELGVSRSPRSLLRVRDPAEGRRTRATIRRGGSAYLLFVSGAPETVFAASTSVPPEARAWLDQQTRDGRRMIAVATRRLTAGEAELPFGELEQDLELRGVIAFEDRPRPGVADAIATASRAGIRTIMVTGDHPVTAAYIANEVGIPARNEIAGDEIDRISEEALRRAVEDVGVFARSTPEHKYRIVRALQAEREVVSVTGDGINDVLALKAADIGIAMGARGTDAAREAAGAVLADDDFNTVADAIFEGRVLFDNLSKAMRFYLAVKAALVAIFLLPVLIGIPLPFAPIQIILLELFMDLAASAAFTSEPRERDVYTRGPRDPETGLFDRDAVLDIAAKGVVLFVVVTGVYLYARGHAGSQLEAQTYAFSAWMIGTVALAFVSRSDHDPLATVGAFSNRVMDAWAVLAIAFLLLVVYVPGIRAAVRVAWVNPLGLLAVAGVTIGAALTLELRKLLPSASRVASG
jgi:Ca2+-transporting ATPase